MYLTELSFSSGNKIVLLHTVLYFCSNYGPLVEDLIQVLLSVEVEGRPSAEQVRTVDQYLTQVVIATR